MTVVIDCNVFVVCLTSRSPYHYIYRSLVQRKFTLVVSQEILLEYDVLKTISFPKLTAISLDEFMQEL